MKRITQCCLFSYISYILCLLMFNMESNQIHLKVHFGSQHKKSTTIIGFRGFQFEWQTSCFKLHVQLTYVPNMNKIIWKMWPLLFTSIHIPKSCQNCCSFSLLGLEAFMGAAAIELIFFLWNSLKKLITVIFLLNNNCGYIITLYVYVTLLIVLWF